NDNFTNALVLPAAPGGVSANNFCASKEIGEPNHAGDAGGHSLWFAWPSPANGPVEFNTIGSSFDTTLAVYTGTNAVALNLMASDDDSGGGFSSRLGFASVAGTTYFVAVDGYGGAVGDFTL